MDEGQSRAEKTYYLLGGAALWVVNYRGKVYITGWDQPQVRVAAFKRGEDAFGRPDGRWVRRLAADQNGNLVRLQAEAESLPSGPAGDMARAIDMDIRVPRQSLVIVESPNGLVVVGDIAGAVYLRTATGALSLRRVSGRVLVLSDSGSCTGDWLRGEGAFRLGGGSLEWRESALYRLDGETATGDIGIQTTIAPDGQYSLRSRSGSIVLRLPVDSKATLDLHSDTGQIETALGDEVSASGPQRVLRVGAGGPAVALQTVHGDLQVQAWRWEGEPQAPPLPAGPLLGDLPAGTPEEMAWLQRVDRGELSAAEALARLAGLPPAW